MIQHPRTRQKIKVINAELKIIEDNREQHCKKIFRNGKNNLEV